MCKILKRFHRNLTNYPGLALSLPGTGSRWRLGGGGWKDQLRSLDRAAQEKDWRRRGGGSRGGLENRRADLDVQGMREIDSPFRFEAPSGIVQHEIGEIDPLVLDAVGSLNG